MSHVGLFKINNIILILVIALCGYQFYSGTKQYAMIQKLNEDIRELREEITTRIDENYKMAKVIEEQKTLISQQEFDIANLNTIINSKEENIKSLENGTKALQEEIKRLYADSSYWYKKAKDKDKVIEKLSETTLDQLENKGVVIDEESSEKVISSINSNLFDDWVNLDTRLQIKSEE